MSSWLVAGTSAVVSFGGVVSGAWVFWKARNRERDSIVVNANFAMNEIIHEQGKMIESIRDASPQAYLVPHPAIPGASRMLLPGEILEREREEVVEYDIDQTGNRVALRHTALSNNPRAGNEDAKIRAAYRHHDIHDETVETDWDAFERDIWRILKHTAKGKR